jgi:hypothetical protein
MSSRCTRSWWRGGHCWHFVEFRRLPYACEATGTNYGTRRRKILKCCICQCKQDFTTSVYDQPHSLDEVGYEWPPPPPNSVIKKGA